MSQEKCKKCERELGPEVLSCPNVKFGSCSFRVRRKLRSRDSRIILSLYGIALLTFTIGFYFSSVEDYQSHNILILKLLILTFLFVISFVTFTIATILLRKTEDRVLDVVTRNYWKRKRSGASEISTEFVTNWKELNWYGNLKGVPPVMSRVFFEFTEISDKVDDIEEDIELLSEHCRENLVKTICNLLMQDYLKGFIADNYHIDARILDTVRDEKTLYLSVSKSLPKRSGPLEQKIYNTILNLQQNDPDRLPVSFEQIFHRTYERENPIYIIYRDLLLRTRQLNRKSSLESRILKSQDVFEAYTHNIQELGTNGFQSELEFVNTSVNASFNEHLMLLKQRIWSKLLTFKQVRNFLVASIFLCFLLLRFYLPVFRVEQVVDRVKEKIVNTKTKGADELDRIRERLNKLDDTTQIDQAKRFIESNFNKDQLNQTARKIKGKVKQKIDQSKQIYKQEKQELIDEIVEKTNSGKAAGRKKYNELKYDLETELRDQKREIEEYLSSKSADLRSEALRMIEQKEREALEYLPDIDRISRTDPNLLIREQARRLREQIDKMKVR